jgi:hypothetical protein
VAAQVRRAGQDQQLAAPLHGALRQLGHLGRGNNEPTPSASKFNPQEPRLMMMMMVTMLLLLLLFVASPDLETPAEAPCKGICFALVIDSCHVGPRVCSALDCPIRLL